MKLIKSAFLNSIRYKTHISLFIFLNIQHLTNNFQ